MSKLLQMTLLAGVLLGVGCGGSECHQVCAREHDCISGSSDVDSCTKTCEQRSADSADHASRVHDCNTCIAGKTCSDSVSRCFSLCVGL
jgi:hypothetical protein